MKDGGVLGAPHTTQAFTGPAEMTWFPGSSVKRREWDSPPVRVPRQNPHPCRRSWEVDAKRKLARSFIQFAKLTVALRAVASKPVPAQFLQNENIRGLDQKVEQ